MGLSGRLLVHSVTVFAIGSVLLLAACAPQIRTVAIIANVSPVIQKTAISGAPLFLGRADTVDPECRSVSLPVARIAQAPTHGTVQFVTRDVYPNFPANSPLAICNRTKIPAVVAEYTSNRGFLGSDFAAVEFIVPSGRDTTYKTAITVK